MNVPSNLKSDIGAFLNIGLELGCSSQRGLSDMDGTSRPESLWLAEHFLDVAAQRCTNYNDATGTSFILIVEDICAQYVGVNS